MATTYSMVIVGTAALFGSVGYMRQGLVDSQSVTTSVWISMLAGGLLGLLTGFVGAGGGFIIVLALIFLLGLSIRHAIGTSLFIFAIKSLLGFAGDVMVVSGIQWTLLAKYIVVALVGIAIGVRLNKRVPAEKIKAGFGWTVLGVGIAILIREFP